MYVSYSSFFPFCDLLDVIDLTWKEAMPARKYFPWVKSFPRTPSHHYLWLCLTQLPKFVVKAKMSTLESMLQQVKDW